MKMKMKMIICGALSILSLATFASCSNPKTSEGTQANMVGDQQLLVDTTADGYPNPNICRVNGKTYPLENRHREGAKKTIVVSQKDFKEDLIIILPTASNVAEWYLSGDFPHSKSKIPVRISKENQGAGMNNFVTKFNFKKPLSGKEIVFTEKNVDPKVDSSPYYELIVKINE